MTSGGARTRSGPAKDETSARSEALGYKLTALPAGGYTGEAPKFPLTYPRAREKRVWAELWRTPQACAWSTPTYQWMHPLVAMYVRVKVRCENTAAPASLIAQMIRLADQIGLTSAGLGALGWKIPFDELAAKRADHEPPAEASEPTEPRQRRLR